VAGALLSLVDGELQGRQQCPQQVLLV
jgi:hypothetical protein